MDFFLMGFVSMTFSVVSLPYLGGEKSEVRIMKSSLPEGGREHEQEWF